MTPERVPIFGFGPVTIHPCHLSEELLLRQCEVRSDRRSGPGGQHRNKVETAIIIRHLPSGISAEASERRSQADNRRSALQRLRLSLAVGLRCQPPQEPAAVWRGRVANGRIAIAADHRDFPSLLADVLDHLCTSEHSLPATAQYFGVTASQLIKLLKKHAPALTEVNAQRQRQGLHRLS